MKLLRHVAEWLSEREQIQRQGLRLGLVPTMGALHAGHLSLVERARADNDRVLVTVFVNPTQFDQPADLAAYPITLDADQTLLGDSADYLLAPPADEVYPRGYLYQVHENQLSQRFCGAHRPGHFDGMLTVVLKLFGLAGPCRAYFGEKDLQQLELVRAMAADFFLPVEVVGCPLVREGDGLAMSSRNRRLTPPQREQARLFPELLRSAPTAEAARQQLAQAGFEVDYVEEWAPPGSLRTHRLGAVRLGDVRLIDNL